MLALRRLAKTTIAIDCRDATVGVSGVWLPPIPDQARQIVTTSPEALMAAGPSLALRQLLRRGIWRVGQGNALAAHTAHFIFGRRYPFHRRSASILDTTEVALVPKLKPKPHCSI